jgi:hypothetical protein
VCFFGATLVIYWAGCCCLWFCVDAYFVCLASCARGYADVVPVVSFGETWVVIVLVVKVGCRFVG